MPSFFTSLKRLMQGKPVYNPSDISPSQSPQQAPSSTNVENKPYPKVYIDETESRVNGDRLECYCYIRNDSVEDVQLDKMRMLGSAREIDSNLRAGDRRQFMVCSEVLPKNTTYNDAELQYRDMTGNYFVSRHDVRFKENGAGTYLVERMPYENTSKI